jgi:hypothetical protein
MASFLAKTSCQTKKDGDGTTDANHHHAAEDDFMTLHPSKPLFSLLAYLCKVVVRLTGR